MVRISCLVALERVCIPLHSTNTLFHFGEIQSTFCLYLQTGLEFFNQILQLWSKFQWKHFEIPIFKISNICVCAHCNHLLVCIIYKFPVIIRILNLHWRYILISEVGQWFYQLYHATCSKNLFWSVNCTLFYNQIYSVQMSFWYLVERLTFIVRSCTLESISRKRHVTTFMSLSIDAIYQELTEAMARNFYIVCKNDWLHSCACANVSDFEYRNIKIFLLRIRWELQNLFKKFQFAMKI